MQGNLGLAEGARQVVSLPPFPHPHVTPTRLRCNWRAVLQCICRERREDPACAHTREGSPSHNEHLLLRGVTHFAFSW